MKTCQILGAPVQSGASQPGCVTGPAAFRTSGLSQALTELGWAVTGLGDAAPTAEPEITPILRSRISTLWRDGLAVCPKKLWRWPAVAIFRSFLAVITRCRLAPLRAWSKERRGARQARLMTDLAASLFGRRVFDRATTPFYTLGSPRFDGVRLSCRNDPSKLRGPK